MSFLYPAFLIGSIAIALPIVLHLLRRDVAPEVPFTAVRLLRRSPVERPERRRLRELILLAARVVALLLLAAAFARPYVQGATPSNVTVIAVDRSYSMSGDRFARALELAREAIDRAGRGDGIAVIAFDARADVLAQPGGAAEARAVLRDIAPGFGATRYEPVFEKAVDLAAGAPGRLIVVTDLQRSGFEGETPRWPAGWQLETRDVGPAGANVAVMSVSVENDRVVVALRNSGDAPRAGTVRATLDGREVARAPYTVPARGAGEIPLAWRSSNKGALQLAIDDPGGLAADDTRFVVLGGRGSAKALLVTSGGTSGLYLTQALATSAGEADGFEAETTTGARLGDMTVERLSAYEVVALLTTRGVDRKAREAIVTRIAQGGGLLIAAGPNLDAGVAAALTDWQPAWAVQADGSGPAGGSPATFAPTDLRHPIFRPFGPLAANLGQVRFDRAWRVASDGWSVLARFSDGTPALLERALGRGRVVLFASDVDRRWNDFPLHPAFVPFALETVRHVAGTVNHRIGDYTVGQTPPGTGPAPGVYKTADGRNVSVNVDTRESAFDRLTEDAFVQMVQRSPDSAPAAIDLQARQTESRQSYWQYGLLVMIAALVAESFVGRR